MQETNKLWQLLCKVHVRALGKQQTSCDSTAGWHTRAPASSGDSFWYLPHPPLLEPSKGWGSAGSAAPSEGREVISPPSSQGTLPSLYLMNHRWNRGLSYAVSSNQPPAFSFLKISTLDSQAYLYFSLLPFDMELRFLALQGLRQTKICPSSLSNYDNSSPWHLTALWPECLAFGTTRQQCQRWQPCYDSHCHSASHHWLQDALLEKRALPARSHPALQQCKTGSSPEDKGVIVPEKLLL